MELYYKQYSFTMVIAKKYVVLNPFVGEPKKSDFEIVEEVLPELQENGKLLVKLYLFFSIIPPVL